MSKYVFLILAAILGASCMASASENAAVVLDKDGKVKSLLVEAGPITVDEVKDAYHEVGETDPDFVPPPPTLKEPGGGGASIANDSAKPECPMAEHGNSEDRSGGPVVVFDFGPERTNSAEDRADAEEPPLPQPLYEPNQNGVIVLPGRNRSSAGEGIANPFDIRLAASGTVNELKIKVGGVVMGGDKPTALVNGRPLSAKDRWSGFNVVAVRRASLLLERDGVFVLVPRGRKVSIKIPF